jgi:hypothetical protein
MKAVAWGGDPSEKDVRGQLFNPDGSRSGAEFVVNTSRDVFQAYPSIAALGDGRFVVTWTDDSLTGNDGSIAGIRAQVFNADGSKTGAEFTVNTTTFNDQFRPAVTALANGNIAICWTDFSGSPDDDQGLAVRMQVIDPTGKTVGPEVLVNTYASGNQFQNTIAALADGRFVVAWMDTGGNPGDTSGQAVRAQVFNADGSTSGRQFVVPTTLTADQAEPAITALADGRFVISWSDASGAGLDNSGAAIRGQIFDPREAAISLNLSLIHI